MRRSDSRRGVLAFASKTNCLMKWQQQPPLRDLIQPSQAIEYEQEPLNALRERFIAGLRYIAANPRQRALMQILYQRCEFSSDMLSNTKFANVLVLIIHSLAASCSAACVTIYCQPKQTLR